MAVTLKQIDENDTHTTLALKGRLDMDGSWEIERSLLDYTSVDMRHLLIDMSGVEFLGSMAIRVFVRTGSALMRKQKKLVLFAAQPPVGKTLQVSGFTAAIPLVQSLAEARAMIGV